jgi:hypothetical protein
MRIAINEHEVDPASPIVDQIRASDNETFDHYSKMLPELCEALDTDVQELKRGKVDPEVAAFLLAATSDTDMSVCSHLHSPIPMVIDLTHRRMMCNSCVSTAPRLTVDEDDDSCDFCRRTGIERFWPIVTFVGSTIICGEACDSCSERVQMT